MERRFNRRFNIVLSRPDGGVEVHPMKEWLRQNPEHIPAGLDATHSTSYQIRDGLKKLGWVVEELTGETRLLKSDVGSSIRGILGGDEEPEGVDEPEQIGATFALEYQLRDFLSQNLDSVQIRGARLKLFVDPTGRDGVEFRTPVGAIDILAVDNSGAFFVFELKRARSPDHAIGQLARYMGWLKQTLARETEVHGVIVAKEIGPKLRYAASVIPNVNLLEYQIEFTLREAGELPDDG